MWVDWNHSIASFISALTIGAPQPIIFTIDARWSREVYLKDESSCEIPSLTLEPVGDDRSTIKRHFPGLFFLGMTPRGLV